jgi:hypothetical protein
MKAIITAALLILLIGNIEAADTESYQFLDHLKSLSGPVGPEIIGDTVIFTAPSTYRRVGISFAFEGYGRVYWLQKLLVPEDSEKLLAATKKNPVPPNRDSGILFHLQALPRDKDFKDKDLEYRMIIDGLWTVDPLNPRRRIDASGLAHSTVPLPQVLKTAAGGEPVRAEDLPGCLRFSYDGPAGELITVAGSFNGWDPFMYELREIRPGSYVLTLPLPAGTYQYLFFHRGEWLPDPGNENRVYTNTGSPVSQAVVE